MALLQMLALGVVVAAGLWLIFVGYIAASVPQRALHYLSLMGSSLAINFAELIPRGLVGLAMVIHAPASRAADLFGLFGWFLAISAAAILLVPYRWHNAFARAAATRIPIPAVRWMIAPVSVLGGSALIWAAF